MSKAEIRLRPWAMLGLVLLCIQLCLGALTSANFAGPACSTLPGCEGSWASISNLLSGMDLSRRLELDSYGRIDTGSLQLTLHMAHRLAAMLTLLVLGWLAVKAFSLGEQFRATGMGILLFLTLQIGLGIAGVLTGLPLLLMTAHNASAAILLLAVVNLVHLLTPLSSPDT